MKKSTLIALLFISSHFISAQTTIKTMFYNVMHYPSTYVYDNATDTFIDRSAQLKLIVDEIQPDIFMVCELENSTGADAILNNVLNVGTSKYAAPNFTLNQSSSYTLLNQFAYYNTDKLELTNQAVLQTTIRDINWYTFILNTSDKATNPIYLEVFVAHLKASNTANDEIKRLNMLSVFTDNLVNIPSDHHILISGDFNLYTNTESGYQELIDPTNAIVMKDPAQREGSWHNNSSFQDVFSQSPLTSNSHFSSGYGSNGPGSDGVYGGIDDRFDFIMLDEGTINSAELYYVPNSYKVFGNNGNCFNSAVNSTSCNGTYSLATRNNLFNMSDHLPVTLDLEYAGTLSVDEHLSDAYFNIQGSNIVHTKILVAYQNNLNNNSATIYNSFGQKITTFTFESSTTILPIDVSNLSTGIYYIKLNNKLSKPLKFIKID